MNIHESAEAYLETILKLQQRNGQERSVEIAEEMGITKPSVCRAMKLLRENGYLEMDAHSNITLLEKGKVVAESIYTRHRALTKLFTLIGVDEETVAEDACKVEHVLSELTFQKLMALTDTLSKNRVGGSKSEPTSHTTVRTVRYTAVQSHQCKLRSCSY